MEIARLRSGYYAMYLYDPYPFIPTVSPNIFDDKDLFINSVINTRARNPNREGRKRNVATTVITGDYSPTLADYYIGVDIKEETLLLLPDNAPSGTQYIIKLEYSDPIGERILSIETSDGSTIDGKDALVMDTAYKSIRLLRSSNEWFTV